MRKQPCEHVLPRTPKNQARNTEVPTTKRDVKAQRRWARGDARGAGRALQASGEGAAQSAPARPLSAGKEGKRRPGPRRAAGERRPRRAWERRADARRCLRKTSEETTSALGTHRLCRWPLLPCNARATTQHELTATPRAQNVPRLGSGRRRRAGSLGRRAASEPRDAASLARKTTRSSRCRCVHWFFLAVHLLMSLKPTSYLHSLSLLGTPTGKSQGHV